MPPSQVLVRDYTTFGDLSQRDLYHRHKNQIVKEDAVENFFYYLNAANVPVHTGGDNSDNEAEGDFPPSARA